MINLYSKRAQNIFYVLSILQFIAALGSTIFYLNKCGTEAKYVIRSLGFFLFPVLTLYMYARRALFDIDVNDEPFTIRGRITKGDKYFIEKFGSILLCVSHILMTALCLGLFFENFKMDKIFCR